MSGLGEALAELATGDRLLRLGWSGLCDYARERLDELLEARRPCAPRPVPLRRGYDDLSNLASLCAAHHLHAIHLGWMRVSGDAPDGLSWQMAAPPGSWRA